MNKQFISGLLTLTLLGSCAEETTAPAPEIDKKAPLTVEFDNIVGDCNLQLGTGTYTTAAGERFTVSLFQYFISNIKLQPADGTTFAVSQDSSYFLVRESEPASQFLKVRVPEGDYTRLTFTVGVDSLRSIAPIGQRTGVLDPGAGMDDGMYWG